MPNDGTTAANPGWREPCISEKLLLLRQCVTFAPAILGPPSPKSQNMFSEPESLRTVVRTPHALASPDPNPAPPFEMVLGELTDHRGIALDAHPRKWLVNAPICPALSEYSIAHLGVVDALPPYRYLSGRMPVTEFLACLSGEGRILLDGRWASLRAGQGVMLPMYCSTEYFAMGR